MGQVGILSPTYTTQIFEQTQIYYKDSAFQKQRQEKFIKLNGCIAFAHFLRNSMVSFLHIWRISFEYT